MKRAFITDVHYRMGLAAVRSLGRRSIDITALEYDTIPQKSILGFYSRYASDRRLLPSAAEDKSGFINSIINLAAECKGNSNKGADMGVRTDANVSAGAGTNEKPVLIAVGIDTLLAVCEYSELLEPHVDFIVPSLESVEIANDKQRLIDIAKKTGIPCPETTTLSGNETVEQLSERIKYPVVIKYRKGEALKLKPAKRYKIVENRQTFIEAYSQMHSIQEFPLAQEYVKGEGFGVSAVFDRNGEPLEIFCHKRLREYPVTGGPSCFCESIWDDKLIDYAVRLLKELNWRGVAMVEFKGSLETGVYLMEINPRFWGSLPLSIISGCDIPYAIYRAATGELSGERTGSTVSGGQHGERTGSTVSGEQHGERTGSTVSGEQHGECAGSIVSGEQGDKTSGSTAVHKCGYKCGYKQGARMRFLFQDLLSLPGYMRMKKNKFKFLFEFIGQLLNPRIKDGVLEMKDLRPSLAYIRQAIKKAGG